MMDVRKLDAEIEAKRAATFQESEPAVNATASDVDAAFDASTATKGPKKPLGSIALTIGYLIAIAGVVVSIYGFVLSVLNFSSVLFKVQHGFDPYSFWYVFPPISSALCIAASSALIWFGRRRKGRVGKVWFALDVVCLIFCLMLCIPYLRQFAVLGFIYYVLSPLMALFTGSGIPAF